jgi:hypothetical protein
MEDKMLVNYTYSCPPNQAREGEKGIALYKRRLLNLAKGRRTGQRTKSSNLLEKKTTCYENKRKKGKNGGGTRAAAFTCVRSISNTTVVVRNSGGAGSC